MNATPARTKKAKEAMADAEGYIRALAAILATHPKVIEHDPELAALADEAMADAESLIRDLVYHLREDGILEHQPEIAALVDEAKAHVEALRKARIDL